MGLDKGFIYFMPVYDMKVARGSRLFLRIEEHPGGPPKLYRKKLSQIRHGSFRKLGYLVFWGPYKKGPTI